MENWNKVFSLSHLLQSVNVIIKCESMIGRQFHRNSIFHRRPNDNIVKSVLTLDKSSAIHIFFRKTFQMHFECVVTLSPVHFPNIEHYREYTYHEFYCQQFTQFSTMSLWLVQSNKVQNCSRSYLSYSLY